MENPLQSTKFWLHQLLTIFMHYLKIIFSVRKFRACQKRVKMVVPIAINSLLRQLYGGIILAEYYSKLSIFIHLVTRARGAVNPPGECSSRVPRVMIKEGGTFIEPN